MSYNWDKYKFKNVFDVDKFKISGLADGIKISTISASCHLNTPLNLKLIHDHLNLHYSDILVIKKNNQDYRSLITLKQTKRRSKAEQEKKKTTSFQNSLSVVVRKDNDNIPKEELEKCRKVNLKLFNSFRI